MNGLQTIKVRAFWASLFREHLRTITHLSGKRVNQASAHGFDVGMGPRHGSTVTSVSLPSRYTFPSVLRTKTRIVEDSVSGSSRASIQYDIYSSTSRPSPFSRFESTLTTTPCRSLGASSVSTVNLNRCPTFMIDCIVFNRPFWFANDNTSAMLGIAKCPVSPFQYPFDRFARCIRQVNATPSDVNLRWEGGAA